MVDGAGELNAERMGHGGNVARDGLIARPDPDLGNARRSGRAMQEDYSSRVWCPTVYVLSLSCFK